MNLLGNHRHFFLFTAILFGIVYNFIIPPFQSPDETSHYFRVVHLTDGNLVGIKENNRQGGKINEAHIKLKNEFYKLRFNSGKILEHQFVRALAINKNELELQFVDFPNTSFYSPSVYVPQILGSIIGKKINNSLISFYLVRLVTLLVWVIIILVTLEKIPFHKWTITFLTLLPSSIFLHASVNGDAITNALSFLLVGIIIGKVVSKSKENNFFFIFMVFLITSTILLNKIIYFPIVGLILLVPSDCFYDKKQKIVWISVLFSLVFLVLTGWYLYTKSQFISYDDYNPLYRNGLQLNAGVDPGAQMSYVLRNPLTFMRTVIFSVWETKAATIAHYIGKFGWEKNYIPTPIIGILTILILLNAIFEKPKQAFSLSNRARALLIGLALIMMGGLTLLMYLHWNPVGADRISNLSGRYFIPIFPLLFLALKNDRFKLVNYEQLRVGTCIFIWIALCSGVWSAYHRYWV